MRFGFAREDGLATTPDALPALTLADPRGLSRFDLELGVALGMEESEDHAVDLVAMRGAEALARERGKQARAPDRLRVARRIEGEAVRHGKKNWRVTRNTEEGCPHPSRRTDSPSM